MSDILKINRFKKNYWIQYVMLYLTLLFKTGFVFFEKYSRYTSIFLLLFLLLASIYYEKKISYKSLIFFSIVTVSIMLSWLFCGLPLIEEITLVLLNLATILLLVNFFSREDFSFIYSNLLFIMAIFSIIGWILISTNLSIYKYLPALTNSQNRTGHFAIFAIISDLSETGAQRAQGIFWEPGAFQCFLIVAMIIESLKKRSMKTILKEIVFSLAIFLTFSTTGIVCLAIFWVYFLNKNQKQNIKVVGYILIIIAATLIFLLMSENITGYLRFAIVDKIKQVFNYRQGVGSAASSRVDSIIYPIKICFANIKYLIFGYGLDGMLEIKNIVGHTMLTCTPINYLFKYGICLAVLSCISFFRLVRSWKLSLIDFVVLCLLILLTVSTEELTLNPVLLCYLFWGFTSKSHARQTRLKKVSKESYENIRNK